MAVYRVNTMTLTDFVAYLRDHGIPCSIDSAKRMIEARVFGDAAFACPDSDPDESITYIIIPKRLEQWFVDNADEVRDE